MDSMSLAEAARLPGTERRDQKRTDRNTPNYGVAVAAFLNRFTEQEKVKLAVLLGQYQALPAGQVRV